MGDLSAAEYLQAVGELLRRFQVTDASGDAYTVEEGIARAADRILTVRSEGRKVMAIGNGGSAAVASHVQNDLANAVGVRAMVFHEPPLLTALSNDHGPATVFERPLVLWAQHHDLLVAISSSGRSENILRGVRAALEQGCWVITLSGFGAENPLRRMGHLNFYVPSERYGHVESAHAVLAHCVVDRVKSARAASADVIGSRGSS